MPRGISRAKHPELYGGKPTNVTKLPTKKTWSKGTQKLGTKPAVQHTSKMEELNQLTSHLQTLTTIRNQMHTGADVEVINDEILDLTDIIVAKRKELYPNIEEPTAQETAPVQPTVQATPPAFVPPPAPGIQPHA